MSALVAYRRRRAKAMTSRGWDVAIEYCARHLENGAVATIHMRGCGENYGERCDCPPGGVAWVGPAVKDAKQ